MLGILLLSIVIIICLTILAYKYIEACQMRQIGLFANPKYEERIRRLENFVSDLDKMLKEENNR